MRPPAKAPSPEADTGLMLRAQGWRQRARYVGPLACLLITAGLAVGGMALGASNTISTVAGDGSGTYAGDAGPATLASLKYPEGVDATPDGGFLIADKENSRIRRVASDGTITTVAGTGTEGHNGDGIDATTAKIAKPEGVAALLDGGFLIADTNNQMIRRVTPVGTIETVAGTGSTGYTGDGGDATLAKLDHPRAAIPTSDGGFLIADTGNRVVRRVAPDGTISTVAGNGGDGSDGDGGPATAARLGDPDDVVPTLGGGFLIADYKFHVVRRVAPDGTISTIVGDPSQGGSTGDGGPAADALLDTPTDVEVLPDGGFLIADHDRDQVRHVRADGVIVNFAGTGQNGYAGDGGPATAADLHGPHALSLTHGGDVLIADADNHRIRSVDSDFVPPPSDNPPPGDPPAADDDPSQAAPQGPSETTSEPVLGESVVMAPAFGMVKVKLPGGDHWTLLERGLSLPVGTVVNVLNGSVVLTSAIEGEDGSQTGTFWDGIFEVRQARGGNGMTNLVLRGGDLRRCRAARRAGPSALSSRRRRPSRRLWAKDDNGRFRTHGRDSVATTRGTMWLTADRCKGTVTRVREGQVRVRHRHSRRSVLVNAGERYLAPHEWFPASAPCS